MSGNNNGMVTSRTKMSCVLRGLKFILFSYVLSVALIAVLSALVVYTKLPESISTPAVKMITFFSFFFSAFLTARTSASRGWLCGAAVGASGAGILILIGMAIYGFNPFTLSNLLSIGLGALVGIAGGIFGINSQKG